MKPVAALQRAKGRTDEMIHSESLNEFKRDTAEFKWVCRETHKMNDAKTAAIHINNAESRPLSLGEYRAQQEASGQRLERIFSILQELKASC